MSTIDRGVIGITRFKIVILAILSTLFVLMTSVETGASASPVRNSHTDGQTLCETDPVVIYCVTNTNWTGYSAWAGGDGEFTTVSADWIVPQVTCPSGPVGDFELSRAAVWAGLWGTKQSIQNGTAWLPQIGTTSECNSEYIWPDTTRPIPTPGFTHYQAVWEMATSLTYKGKQQGNSAQPIWGFSVNPGDAMLSEVDYLGDNGANEPQFELHLTDLTTGQKVEVHTGTTLPVTDLSTILHQGGAVVEGDSAGLAQFKTPIDLNFDAASADNADIDVLPPVGGIGYNEWVLNNSTAPNADPLATNSSLMGCCLTYPGEYPVYTVTWDASN
jgi:Peptidase A4 family